MAEMFPCSKHERVGVVDDPCSRVSSEGGMADGRNVPSLETRVMVDLRLAFRARRVAGGKKPLLEMRRARVGEGNITNETTRVKPLLVALKLCKNLVANK